MTQGFSSVARCTSGYPREVTPSHSSAARILKAVADLLRAAVLLAAIVAAISSAAEGAVRLTLLFGFLVALRLVAIAPVFDFAVCLLLPLATVASLMHWYQRFLWLDWLMHFVTTAAVVTALYLVLLRGPLLSPSPSRTQSRAQVVFVTMTIGTTVGVLWEFYEWFVQIVVGVYIGVGYTDTIADLAMDLLGSILAGAAVLTWSARRRASYEGIVARDR